jgi:hypothetical protein
MTAHGGGLGTRRSVVYLVLLCLLESGRVDERGKKKRCAFLYLYVNCDDDIIN